MLTVRVNGIHGEVLLFQTHRVIKGNFEESHTVKELAGRPYCEFFEKDGMPSSGMVSFGNVYVMNEMGKTVATYELGGFELANVPPKNK